MSKLWPDYPGRVIVHFGDEATRQTAERTRRASEAIAECGRWADGIVIVGPPLVRDDGWIFNRGAELVMMAKQAGLEVYLGSRAIEDWGTRTSNWNYLTPAHWAMVAQHANDGAKAAGCKSCWDIEAYGESAAALWFRLSEFGRLEFTTISWAMLSATVQVDLVLPCDSRDMYAPAWLARTCGKSLVTEITYRNRKFEWMTDLSAACPFPLHKQPNFVGVHLGPMDLPITDPNHPPPWGPQEFWSAFPRTECLTRYTEGIFVYIDMADFYRTSTTMAGLVAEGGVA